MVAAPSNTIFWENHDQTTARTGTGIQSNVLNKLLVRGNLFSGNGPSDTNPSDDAINVGNGFIPANLKATPDQLGNFTGAPAFIAPRDPRPGSDGPATFFLDANYDLNVKSAAIDAAISSLAPSLDFLYRGHVKVVGRGFPGTGPADVGAFEFQGTGGTVVGTGFRVATTSLSPTGSQVSNGNTTFSSSSPPTSITVTFSDTVNKATVTPGVLIMYGDGLNPVGPARATSVTWINDHTARFNLSRGFSSQGSVVVKINAGAIKSVSNAAVAGFTDMFRIRPFVNQSQTLTPAPAPSPVAAAVVAAPVTPAPAASPKGPSRKGLIGRALRKR
jgi:large repetitive protein